ncbi:hypothetical protein ACJMK2_009836 [Sinanodonta woodiana]|uniref:Uncharacterized protein n=1 Tax=Sinanodonta woodiana TaxID=1069815 RepID=A0ABD3VGA1_SINWO
MFLVLCFLVLLVPAESGLAKKTIRSADVCVPGVTIDETAVKDFENVKSLYDDVAAARSDLGDLLRNVTQEELIPFELASYYHDVCPSEMVSTILWGIPYGTGYKCWTVQHVLYARCRTKECQYWNAVPWIPNYRFVCREKRVYEYVWSFCVADSSRLGFFQLIKVQIPKSCVCSLTMC